MYLKKGKKTQRELGSEWGYFGKTKDLMVWSCNMKQLNFRHFNINTKKFAVTVIFFPEWNTNCSQKTILFCFDIFPFISEDFRKLPNISEDVQRKPKIFEEKSENFQRADKNWQCQKTIGLFSTKKPPNITQYFLRKQ